MLTPEQINNIHRLHWVEKQSVRKIARHLHLGRRTIAKYLTTPAPPPVHSDRSSKLDSFKPVIAELLEQDSTVSVALIEQRLRAQGFDGGMTIVKDYVRTLRKSTAARRAYVRMEPAPGDRFDIDWGHFGALDYDGTPRKLYAFCLVECHSRKTVSSSSPIVKVSKPSCAATCMPSRQWPASLASSGTTISPRPSPSTMAIWFDSIRASSLSLAKTASSRVLVMSRRPGKKERSNAPSDIFGRTSGRCARSPIWRM